MHSPRGPKGRRDSKLGKLCEYIHLRLVSNSRRQTDGACHRLWGSFGSKEDFHLPNLRSLKLRQASLSDSPINIILEACPNLRRLDLSFTLIKNPALPPNKLLEKLVLTSTVVPSDKLVSLITGQSNLKVLSLGAMGGKDFSTAGTLSAVSGTTITDKTLRKLIDALEGFPALERVSLVWNTRIGFNTSAGSNAALSRFIRRVGRRCKVSSLVVTNSVFGFLTGNSASIFLGSFISGRRTWRDWPILTDWTKARRSWST